MSRGHAPFRRRGLGPILKRITVEPVRPLHDASSEVPLALCSLVDRMLSRAKENRPSLAEVRETLARATSAPLADLPTRMEAKLPRVTPIAPVLPPSTTMGVASRRPIDTPAKTGSRRAATIGIATAVLAVAGGATLTAIRFARKPESIVVPSASPASTPSDEASAPATALSQVDPNTDASSAAALAGPAPAPATAAAARPSDHTGRARAAFDKRDGATCLREYDEADRAEPNVALHSTNPASGTALTRARCMLLAGDCDGGRALFRASRAAHEKASDAELDLAADRIVAETCTGAIVSPRDQLLRSSVRLRETSEGKRKATAKECLDWYATIARFAGTVPPRSSEDHIGRVRDDTVKTAPTCLARAGDCPSSYRVFRDEILRTRRPAPSEPDIRDEYDVLTTQLHLCQGTP